MSVQKVMIRTYLNQPIVRFFLGYKHGGMLVSNEEEGRDGGWVVDPSQVFEYDEDLYQRMAAFDSILDDEPEALLSLWSEAQTKQEALNKFKEAQRKHEEIAERQVPECDVRLQ